ncbi:MAG: hypothetical protein KF768_01660 [Phycisphaeraceae bacterium]|nr:hypothetical protein [Phycisphaeraceae bacterium]
MILILIGIMLPSIKRARETALQVVCSSNVRQHGLGLMLYAQDYTDHLPPTKFAPPPLAGPNAATVPAQADQMVILRIGVSPNDWDGLGFLYGHDYLDASKIYYCPSHSGDHPFRRYESAWNKPVAEIVGNYQYRGPARFGVPSDGALIVDALRTKRDFSHRVGANVLRSDYSVLWLADTGRQLINALPDYELEDTAADKVEDAWSIIDAEVQAVKK